MKNKKQFELPKAVIIIFCDDDIIVTSNWGNPDNDDPQDEWP